MPAENIECNRWSYTDFYEKYLQKFEVWCFMPASSAHCLQAQTNELCHEGSYILNYGAMCFFSARTDCPAPDVKYIEILKTSFGFGKFRP